MQIWFTRKIEDQRVALPAYGLPDSLLFQAGRVIVTFPDDLFIRAIALNQDFSPRRSLKIKRLLHARLNSKGEGFLVLNDTSISFFVERHLVGTAAIACQKTTDGDNPLTIVDVNDPLGTYDISIDSGGLVRANYNLRGKTISVLTEILLPMAIDQPMGVRPLPDDAIALHILGDSNDQTWLATLDGCRCLDFDSSQDNLITLELVYRSEEEREI